MFRIEENHNRCTVFVEGDMTIYTAESLKNEIAALLKKTHELQFDMAGVNDIDSAGVQLLVMAKKERIKSNQSLSLTSHSASVLDVLDVMGLLSWFNDPVVLSKNSGG